MVDDSKGGMYAAIAGTDQREIGRPFAPRWNDPAGLAAHAPAHCRNELSVLSAARMHPGLAHGHTLAVQAVEMVCNRPGCDIYRNQLAKLNELEPVVTNFRNAAQEIRDGYNFNLLSRNQQTFINEARAKYPDQPWIAGYRESAARGSFVDSGVRDMLKDRLIPGGELYQKMAVGPDLVPRSGVGLKMEITNYTPSLNAIVTHAWRYPNETMPYVLYRTR